MRHGVYLGFLHRPDTNPFLWAACLSGCYSRSFDERHPPRDYELMRAFGAFMMRELLDFAVRRAGIPPCVPSGEKGVATYLADSRFLMRVMVLLLLSQDFLRLGFGAACEKAIVALGQCLSRWRGRRIGAGDGLYTLLPLFPFRIVRMDSDIRTPKAPSSVCLGAHSAGFQGKGSLEMMLRLPLAEGVLQAGAVPQKPCRQPA